MSVALRRPMSREEFLDWHGHAEGRYEFDGFEPVAMTGGSVGHSALIANLVGELRNQLAGKPCRVFAEAGVATVGSRVRYPDAVITCSPFRPSDKLLPNPVIVFEVVSPTSGHIDRVVKLREYAAVPSIRRYVLIESDSRSVTLLRRTGGEDLFRAEGLGDGEIVPLPEVDAQLSVDALFDGVIPPTTD